MCNTVLFDILINREWEKEKEHISSYLYLKYLQRSLSFDFLLCSFYSVILVKYDDFFKVH